MNTRFAWGIVFTIVVGLTVDAHGAAWSQPAVNVLAAVVFGALLWRSSSADRVSYFVCLVLATVGEVFLALIWGLYDYRLGNLPLFVPPGHVLLYALGRWLADRVPMRTCIVVCALVVLAGGVLAFEGRDELSAPLALLFLVCMRYGPAPRLYAVMFVLALAMELLGTGLGNWTWRPETPWFHWTTLNPPFAAGAFYCVLDLLVGKWGRANGASLARAKI